MPNQRNTLPVQPYYRLEEIAKAIEGFPPQVGTKKGIDCISRKYLPKNFWLKRPDYSFRLNGFAASAPLTDADRIELSRLLPQLPEISDNMSDTEIENFFDEYYKIEDRPNWEPDIKTPANRQKAQRDYDERITEHCENFILKVQSGHFHLFDSDFNVLRGSNLYPLFARKHGLVSREEASKYLKKLELNDIIPDTEQSKRVSKKRWTTDKVNEMRELRMKSTAEETATYFNISTSRMDEIFRKNPLPEDSSLNVSIPNKKKNTKSNKTANAFEVWNKPIKK